MLKNVTQTGYTHPYIAIYFKPYSGIIKKIYPDLGTFKTIVSKLFLYNL